MNERVRSILLGIGLGIAPVLLLDLADTLRQSHAADPAGTSLWWVLACYAATGAISAFGLVAAARDRLLAAVALGVLLLAVLPATPVGGLEGLADLPLVVGAGAIDAVAVTVALAGAYTFVLIRGRG